MFKMPVARKICNDGTSLSVQTGAGLYCSPRNDEGPYTAVEVGFIKDSLGQRMSAPETWLPYADDGSTDSYVFGYIPVELVDAFIAEHGGEHTGSMEGGA